VKREAGAPHLLIDLTALFFSIAPVRSGGGAIPALPPQR